MNVFSDSDLLEAAANTVPITPKELWVSIKATRPLFLVPNGFIVPAEFEEAATFICSSGVAETEMFEQTSQRIKRLLLEMLYDKQHGIPQKEDKTDGE